MNTFQIPLEKQQLSMGNHSFFVKLISTNNYEQTLGGYHPFLAGSDICHVKRIVYVCMVSKTGLETCKMN